MYNAIYEHLVKFKAYLFYYVFRSAEGTIRYSKMLVGLLEVIDDSYIQKNHQ